MGWKSLDDMDISGKNVLIRVDVNVPFQDGLITDTTRIERIKPTIEKVLAAGGKPILLAHFGRPKGHVVQEMSLGPVANAMSDILNIKTIFSASSIGDDAQKAIDNLPENSVLILENTRFHAGEEKNDIELAKQFAKLGDIYCNDAFSASHRAHASTEALARLLPSCAGELMKEELSALEAALSHPKRPVTALVGGAKVSTKLDLLSNLIALTDTIIIGGGMANTFLAAQGHDVGKSLCEHDLLETAKDIIKKAESQNCRLYIPCDVVVAREFKAGAYNEVVNAANCPKDAMILDAGPASIKEINEIFSKSQTLIWNGPLGAFEIEPFNKATDACAKFAAELTKQGQLLSVAGGGDTVSALNASKSADHFTYISTAGGAFLEWLEGKTLPGVAALLQT